MSAPNPFAALLGTSSDESENNQNKTEPSELPAAEPTKNQLENTLEQIFGFTLCEKHSSTKELLLLEDIQKSMSADSLNLDILSHALFDRVFMCNGENETLERYKSKNWTNGHATEDKPIVYLAESYNLMQEGGKLDENSKSSVAGLILQNVATIMIQPEIFETRSVHREMLDVLMENSNLEGFFIKSCQRVLIEENQSI